MTRHDSTFADESPRARANATLVAGLLSEDDGEARRLLAEAVAALGELGLRIDAARAMVDLGHAMARLGEDPRLTLERARPSSSSATRVDSCSR